MPALRFEQDLRVVKNIDLQKRKLAVPSEKFKELYSSLEKTSDFEEIILKDKR